MVYLFHHSIPPPWLGADLLAAALTAVVILFAIRRTLHPGMVVLEGLAFVFLYAAACSRTSPSCRAGTFTADPC
ncbi:MAG: hypothetical protein ACK2UB_10385 [Anaerolineales bacterium]